MEVLTNLWHGSYEEACNPMFLEERRITHTLCCDNLLTDHHTIHDLLQAGHKVIVYSMKDNRSSISTLLEYCIVYKKMPFMIAYYFLKPRILLEDPSLYVQHSRYSSS